MLKMQRTIDPNHNLSRLKPTPIKKFSRINVPETAEEWEVICDATEICLIAGSL